MAPLSLLLVCALALSLVPLASAHFYLGDPTAGRGNSDDTLAQAPCGGFNDPGTVYQFARNGSQVTFWIEDGSGNVTFAFAPTSQASFIALSGPVVAIPETTTATKYQVAIDLTGVADSGATGVLQVIYHSDETFYQCADIKVAGSAGRAAAAAGALLAALMASLLAW